MSTRCARGASAVRSPSYHGGECPGVSGPRCGCASTAAPSSAWSSASRRSARRRASGRASGCASGPRRGWRRCAPRSSNARPRAAAGRSFFGRLRGDIELDEDAATVVAMSAAGATVRQIARYTALEPGDVERLLAGGSGGPAARAEARARARVRLATAEPRPEADDADDGRSLLGGRLGHRRAPAAARQARAHRDQHDGEARREQDHVADREDVRERHPVRRDPAVDEQREVGSAIAALFACTPSTPVGRGRSAAPACGRRSRGSRRGCRPSRGRRSRCRGCGRSRRSRRSAGA